MIVCAGLCLWSGEASAQSLRYKMERIFNDTLRLQLAGSPGEHAGHFNPDKVATSRQTIDAMSSFISANLSNFPLSSTSASITFDLSSGVPVRETSSLGPVFAERARPVGKGRTIMGYSFNFMSLNKIRGTNTQDLRFTFTHEDVGDPGLGDSANEFDTIDLNMNMQMEATVLVFYATHGVTGRLDVSVAMPIVNVRMQADPIATLSSFTFVTNDTANHFFDGTSVNPVLSSTPAPINDDATGVGDIALRAKYELRRGKRLGLAAVAAARLATGDEDNFLGTGSLSYRVGLAASGMAADGATHLNVAYQFNTAEYINDRIDVFLAYDHKLTARTTFAVEAMGSFEVGDEVSALQFKESVLISRPVSEGTYEEEVGLTNLPATNNDHLINGSLGLKYSPREFFIIIGNVLVPLNDDGLRPDALATLGFEFNF